MVTSAILKPELTTSRKANYLDVYEVGDERLSHIHRASAIPESTCSP